MGGRSREEARGVVAPEGPTRSLNGFAETQRWPTTKDVPWNLVVTVPSRTMEDAWPERACVETGTRECVSHMQAALGLGHSSQTEPTQGSAALC